MSTSRHVAVVGGSLAGGVIVTYHRDHRHVGTVAVNVRPVRHRELREAFNVQAVSA